MKMNDAELSQTLKTYKYKIEQCARGARITVHSDKIDEVVYDYMEIRARLESNGFKIAPESGGFAQDA